MFSLNDLGEYEARLNGITFVCDEASPEAEETAAAIAECYREKRSDIARFMLEEGICEYFGSMNEGEVMRAIGAPIISLDRRTITYPDNNFDDMLIIELHYEGLLESFSGLDIDG